MNHLQEKPWYQSKGVWGGILAAAAPVVGAVLHVSINGGDVQMLAQSFANIGSAVTALVAAVGGVVAVVGRVKATYRIG